MVNTSSPSTALYVDTPLGRLKFYTDLALSPLLCRLLRPLGLLKFYTDLAGGKIANLKLAQTKIEPTLPAGMSVSACIAVFLEFSATENVTGFQFHCDWENFDGKGYGNSGEGLDAWEWEHNGHLVMVGTEDADWINARIPLIPLPLTPSEYPITMEANKISIRLEKLPEGKSYSLHFIVAWNPYPEPKDCSCWYAIDVPHKMIAQMFANAG